MNFVVLFWKIRTEFFLHILATSNTLKTCLKQMLKHKAWKYNGFFWRIFRQLNKILKDKKHIRMIKDICIRIFEKFIQIFGINAALSPQMTMDSSFVNTQCLQTLRLQLYKEDKNNSKNSTQKSYAKTLDEGRTNIILISKYFYWFYNSKKYFQFQKWLHWLFFRSLFWVTLVAVQQTFSKSSSSGKKLELYIHEKQEAMAIIYCNVGREGPVFHPWSSITVNVCLGLCESINYSNGRFKFAKAGKNGVGRRRY